MSSAENGRLCWIREGEACDAGIHERWDAAPADPAEGIYFAVSPWIYGRGQEVERGKCVDRVLRALGVPDVPQRPTPRDETS